MISRYDQPAIQNVQNTYVPLPYAELAHSLNVKQHEYDFLKQTTEQADNEVMGIKVPEFIRTSTDYSRSGNVKNPQYQILRQAQAQFAKEKEDLLNSGIDYTTPEGKKAVSQYVSKVARFRNTAGKQIEQDSANIEEHNKNHEEYLKKGVHYAGNAYYADNNVDKFLKQGAGFEKTSLNPYQDRIKIVGDALEKMKSQVTSHKDNNDVQTFSFQGVPIATLNNKKVTWTGVGQDRVKKALSGVIDSELDKGIQREASSYKDFLIGKNSDKIFNKDGSVKKITYTTTDKNGKKVELTEDADKYYYNEKYNSLRKDLEDYAVNTFVSSNVTSSQNNKFLPDGFQVGGDKLPSTIPITTTPSGSITQTSSSTPAKDAQENPASSVLSAIGNYFTKEIKEKGSLPLPNQYGKLGGYLSKVFKDNTYNKKDFEEANNVVKSNLLESLTDPNDKKKAEVLYDHIVKNLPKGHQETIKELLNQVAEEFDSEWNNVKAGININLKPTRTSISANNAITNFVKTISNGAIITDQEGKETSYDPDKKYMFAGADITDKGITFNMANSDKPDEVIKIKTRSDVGATKTVEDRNNLKQIDATGSVKDNILLNTISKHYDGATNYKVVADPNSPSLSSVILLDDNGKQIDEPVPNEVLDRLMVESVGQSIGSSGTGTTPKFK